MISKRSQYGMESPALVSSLLQCGDGCVIPADETECSAVNRCSSPKSYCSSSSGLIAHRGSSPGTELADQEPSVYEAASLLCSLRVNEIENAKRCTNSFEAMSSFEDREEDKCRRVCSCAAVAECCSCSSSASTDAILTSDDTGLRGGSSFTENDPNTSNVENGAVRPCDDVVTTSNAENGVVCQCDDAATTKRCRHATADSSGSMRDYSAIGCDVVFSGGIEYRPYGCEQHLCDIMELVSRDLSEPYSIYTYRYFIYNWPSLCFRVSVSAHNCCNYYSTLVGERSIAIRLSVCLSVSLSVRRVHLCVCLSISPKPLDRSLRNF